MHQSKLFVIGKGLSFVSVTENVVTRWRQIEKNHECSYFFYIVTPTFFVFFGRFFDGEYGATIKKIK